MLSGMFLPKIDGCSFRVYEQARGLAKRHDIYLVTRCFGQIQHFEELDGIKVSRVECKMTSLGRLFFIHNLIKEGIDIIRENKIQVIHAYGPLTGVAGLYLSKIFRIPFLLTVSLAYGQSVIIKEKQLGFKKRIHLYLSRLVTKILIDISSKTLVATSRMKDLLIHVLKLKRLCVNKICVIPYSVSLGDYYIRRSPHDGINILYVGSLSSRKGVSYLLMAFSYILKALRGSDIRLIIVGDGRLRKQLEKLAGELKIRDKVYFIGFVEHHKLPRYYAMADIFVLPSLVEVFGIVLIEAMAMGKPIVSTTAMGPREVVKNGKSGFLVKPRNPHELARAILKLILNDKLREKMGSYGRKIVEQQYSTEFVALELKKIYCDLIGVRSKQANF